ncbi:MAG TPA: ABC transporter ATP-binding protein, partial [Planctomycetota bacterium]|nr:ABC transporter ATP-binding protein [Planctomycetota bacterium]
PGRLLLGAAALLGRSAAGVAQPVLLGAAVDSVFMKAPRAETARTVGFYLVAAVAAGFCQYWMRLILVAASRDFEVQVRSSLFRKLLSLSGSFFDRSRTGDLVSRLTSDVEAVRMGVGPGVMYIADTGIRAALAITWMFKLSTTLTLFVLLPLVVTVFALKRVLRQVQELSLRVQEEQGVLAARAVESFSGARVVKAFAREREEERRFGELSKNYVVLNDRLAASRALFTGFIETAGAATVVLVLLVGGFETLAGRFTVGRIVAYLDFLRQLVWPMIAFGWVMGLWQRAKASAGRLDAVRRELPEVAEPPAPVLPPGGIRGAIEFRRLTWRRPGADRDALVDVNLSIPAGASLGVVGRTGAGKSTLVHLAARLSDPPRGTVFLDGVDVRDIPLDALRAAVGFVPQETLLFSDTLEANVAFGMPDRDPDRIADAVRRAALDEAVAHFPQGLQTVVGERGVTLSGGQRQRTAIARALAIDPKILILDDCLSAVDAETEEKILDRLSDVLSSRTSIVVSHRTSAVARLDLVAVMEDGRVVEFGPPERLAASDGPYAELVKLQRAEEELETL